MNVVINNERMFVYFMNYMTTDNLAITIRCEDGSPYCHVTTNLEIAIADDECFILDTYEDKFIPVPELIDAGIITPTDYTVPSGYNDYRLYKVNREDKNIDDHLGDLFDALQNKKGIGSDSE